MTTQTIIDPIEVLGNSRRMNILRLLRQSGGRVNLEGLVSALAEEEDGISSIKRTRKSLKSSLLLSHIPRLRSAGLVTYDDETEDLSLNTIPPALHPHFETLLLSLYDLLRTSSED